MSRATGEKRSGEKKNKRLRARREDRENERGKERYKEKKRASYSEKGVPKRNVDIVGPPMDLRRGENEVMNQRKEKPKRAPTRHGEKKILRLNKIRVSLTLEAMNSHRKTSFIFFPLVTWTRPKTVFVLVFCDNAYE